MVKYLAPTSPDPTTPKPASPVPPATQAPEIPNPITATPEQVRDTNLCSAKLIHTAFFKIIFE